MARWQWSDPAGAVDKVDDLKVSVDELRNEVRTGLADLRRDLGGQIGDMRRELYATRWTVVGIWIGLAAICIEIALRT